MMNFDEMIRKGQEQSASLVEGGQLLIDVEPKHLRARIILRNVKPDAAGPQVLNFLTMVLTVGAQMMRLEPMQRSHGSPEKEDKE